MIFTRVDSPAVCFYLVALDTEIDINIFVTDT